MRHASLTVRLAATTWVWLGSALALSCTTGQAPAPARESVPVYTAPAPATAPATSPDAASDREALPRSLPTMGLEVFAPAGSRPQAIFAVEGALLVVEDRTHVGRVVGEAIEWIDKKLPPGHSCCGEDVIRSVSGRWPDRLDALYTATDGRMSLASYVPLTGKGRSVGFGTGDTGWIRGMASVGESTVVTFYGHSLGESTQTVRGPAIVRKLITQASAGCKEGEVYSIAGEPLKPAIVPSAFEASAEGTLVAVGRLCEKRAAAAEVWDKTGAVRIIDLGTWVKGDVYGATLLRGSGDDLFLVANAESPILAYKAGSFAPLPPLERPVRNLFVSATGQLHASDGRTIHRLDDGKWIPIARLAWPARFDAMAIEGETIWASVLDSVYRLRPTPGVDYRDGCPTPFVYLYDASPKNGDTYTYPATRKALASFPEISGIDLVEFSEGVRRLGIVVSSKAQGDAVIAHVKASMKDESPALLCYQPTSPRRIDVKPKGR